MSSDQSETTLGFVVETLASTKNYVSDFLTNIFEKIINWTKIIQPDMSEQLKWIGLLRIIECKNKNINNNSNNKIITQISLRKNLKEKV